MLMWIVTPRRSPRRSPEGRIKPLHRDRRQDVFALCNEILFCELWFANCDARKAGGRQLCQEQGIELDPAIGRTRSIREIAMRPMPLHFKKISKNNKVIKFPVPAPCRFRVFSSLTVSFSLRHKHDKQMPRRAEPLHKPMSRKKIILFY